VCPLKQKSDLVDPVGPLNEKLPSSAISAANKKVIKALDDSQESKKRSRRPNLSLNSAQKYEIGKRAAEYGVMASMCYFANQKAVYVDLRIQIKLNL